MDSGEIVVFGNGGDALGYSMRGGTIYVLGNCGYRVGVHMKEFYEKTPTIVIGGFVGSFLGEYLAGGIIIILGLTTDTFPVGNFCGVGMHGGVIYIRSNKPPIDFPPQLSVDLVNAQDLNDIKSYLDRFSKTFNIQIDDILNVPFYKITPNTRNPYRQVYTYN